MTDDHTTHGAARPVNGFDDDRLLAYALGLEEDVALAAALQTDAALRRRFHTVRADVERIGAGLERLVPPPDDSYAEPAAARWKGLGDFFAAPAERSSRRRRGPWRVLAPALGVTLAVLVGAVAVSQMRDGDQPAGDAALKSAPSSEYGVAGARSTTASPVDAHAVVVVARAGAVRDGRQTFTVLRTLKGTAPGTLRLAVLDDAAPQSALRVLYLDPLEDAGQTAGSADRPIPTPATDGAGAGGSSGSASPGSKGALGAVDHAAGGSAGASGVALRYRWRGDEVLVQDLPPGIGASELTLDALR